MVAPHNTVAEVDRLVLEEAVHKAAEVDHHMVQEEVVGAHSLVVVEEERNTLVVVVLVLAVAGHKDLAVVASEVVAQKDLEVVVKEDPFETPFCSSREFCQGLILILKQGYENYVGEKKSWILD